MAKPPYRYHTSICGLWDVARGTTHGKSKSAAPGSVKALIRSKHDNALPLIVTHRWSGSIVEQLKIIEPLIDLTAHGGTAAGAFHLVILSMLGNRSMTFSKPSTLEILVIPAKAGTQVIFAVEAHCAGLPGSLPSQG